ncbi:hypothetical protein RND71_037104 [Anisodus tanguticus]|uniref:Uncharacterized protein n=1 Tax=Anisodus tanguticus TaxID=243964 RepID=A0AAE1R2F8_9SOLA|nr:hypothetical protein RND71_037104 [Anisodus tanguticus]
MQWGGEDWGFPSPVPETEEDFCHLKGSNHSSSMSILATEVKVKITKKQLSELMGKADVQGLSVHQLLTQMMNVSERFELHHHSWRPALQSIPEDS